MRQMEFFIICELRRQGCRISEIARRVDLTAAALNGRMKTAVIGQAVCNPALAIERKVGNEGMVGYGGNRYPAVRAAVCPRRGRTPLSCASLTAAR